MSLKNGIQRGEEAHASNRGWHVPRYGLKVGSEYKCYKQVIPKSKPARTLVKTT